MINLLTDLQFAVLKNICDEEKSGHDIRKKLKEIGYKQSRVSFYQMMARIYQNGFVNKKKIISKMDVAECYYTITAKGRKALQYTSDFYRLDK